MSYECEMLKTCGFFKKYQKTKDLACRGFIARYCKGPKMEQCERKKYYQKYNQSPSDDMLPSGQMVASEE